MRRITTTLWLLCDDAHALHACRTRRSPLPHNTYARARRCLCAVHRTHIPPRLSYLSMQVHAAAVQQGRSATCSGHAADGCCDARSCEGRWESTHLPNSAGVTSTPVSAVISSMKPLHTPAAVFGSPCISSLRAQRRHRVAGGEAGGGGGEVGHGWGDGRAGRVVRAEAWGHTREARQGQGCCYRRCVEPQPTAYASGAVEGCGKGGGVRMWECGGGGLRHPV